MPDPTRPVPDYPAPNHHPSSFSQPPPPPPPAPPCTAYPYAAPLPPTYPYNPQHATFLRRLFAAIIATVIVTATVLLIIRLVLRPRLPHFRVDAFSITSPFNLTTNRLSTSFDVALTAANPNRKISLSYTGIQAAVFYRGKWLAETQLAPFAEGVKEEREVKASFVAVNSFLDSDDGGRMNEERGEGNGSVAFDVRIVADMRFKAGIWRGRRRLLKVNCRNLVVSVSGNGSRSSGLIGGPSQCSVGL